jgi:hypothetical protein
MRCANSIPEMAMATLSNDVKPAALRVFVLMSLFGPLSQRLHFPPRAQKERKMEFLQKAEAIRHFAD